MSRYERQQRLSIWDQDVISNSTVLIVGMGGTGCELAKNLALAGIGKLIIVDPDNIEASNLNRQFFYHGTDVGSSKVDVAKDRLLTLNSHLIVETHRKRIQDVPMKLFARADIVAGCVDNFLARQYINSRSVFHDKVFIDSATDGYVGQVQVVVPQNRPHASKTACLACHMPEPPDETRIVDEPCTLVGVPRKREHCAWKAYYQFFEQNQRAPDENDEYDVDVLVNMANTLAKKHDFPPFDREDILEMLLYHVPSISSVNAVIAGIQTQEIFKMLFLSKMNELQLRAKRKLRDLLSRRRFRIASFIVYSGLTSTFITYDLVPDSECQVCSEGRLIFPKVIEVSSLEDFKNLLRHRYDTNNLWIGRNEFMYHLSEIDHVQDVILRDGELLTILREDDGLEEIIHLRIQELDKKTR